MPRTTSRSRTAGKTASARPTEPFARPRRRARPLGCGRTGRGSEPRETGCGCRTTAGTAQLSTAARRCCSGSRYGDGTLAHLIGASRRSSASSWLLSCRTGRALPSRLKASPVQDPSVTTTVGPEPVKVTRRCCRDSLGQAVAPPSAATFKALTTSASRRESGARKLMLLSGRGERLSTTSTRAVVSPSGTRSRLLLSGW